MSGALPVADSGAFMPPLWDAARDEILVCRQVRDETPDVRSFVFAASEPRLFRFAPGQFLTFTFEIDGEEVQRCYTIASPPTRPDCVAITVKRKPGGRVSPWLHASLRPGMAVRATGPMGDFTLRQAEGGKYLFLSAGSGITPLMSMARTLDDLGSDADVVFVHSARTPADIIFSRELALLAAHRGGFRAALHCTSDRGAEPWMGLRGRLDAAMLRLTAPDFLEREVFVCGPAGYMEGVRTTLQAAGFDLARYHQESFDFTDPATEPPGSPADAGPAAGTFQVMLSRSGLTLSCGGDTTILEASRQAGLRLPSSCTRGVCGTCKSRLVSGTVDMRHGGGIRPREIAQGLILICCSRPTSDVTVER